MAKLTIAREVCKGCGLCADVCPKKLLALSGEINSRGYHPIAIAEQEQCIGCAFCARMCPDAVITVEK
ncbi:MAG: 4Fe-4S dicluster domain-containing protein [Christensenellaceae bacterium]|nr:4Fe-4S dicluster domain-containing protein [Christensenellaceae bacterium]